jgi:hypothetical protein
LLKLSGGDADNIRVDHFRFLGASSRRDRKLSGEQWVTGSACGITETRTIREASPFPNRSATALAEENREILSGPHKVYVSTADTSSTMNGEEESR